MPLANNVARRMALEDTISVYTAETNTVGRSENRSYCNAPLHNIWANDATLLQIPIFSLSPRVFYLFKKDQVILCIWSSQWIFIRTRNLSRKRKPQRGALPCWIAAYRFTVPTIVPKRSVLSSSTGPHCSNFLSGFHVVRVSVLSKKPDTSVDQGKCPNNLHCIFESIHLPAWSPSSNWPRKPRFSIASRKSA